MNREDIIRIAREAGLPLAWISEKGVIQWEQLERFAALISTAKVVKYQDILDLQQRAYEREIEIEVEAEREAIMDEWSACVQSDLENGVRWLNEQAAKKWQESYPAMAGFADKIYARGETK